METIPYTRDIPVTHTADVLVIGGGPAGIGAAIGAAKSGAKTLLVERYGFLGGNATASLVGPFMTSYSADGTTQLIQGVFDELVRRMEAVGGAIHPSKVPAAVAKSAYMKHGHIGVTPFDPETMKLVSAELCLEYGVELLLHTIFIDPIMEGAAIRGAIVHNKGGLQGVRAQVTIDCSADADVAARAGVPFAVGRASDGLTQPMTMFFRVGNVDGTQVAAYFKEHPEEIEQRMAFSSCIKAAQANGDYTIPRERLSMYESPQEGVWRVNVSRILGADGTKAEDLTRAEITGRRQVMEILAFLRKYVPGFSTCTLIDTAAQVGVRETRRIVGAYTLTQEDLIVGPRFRGHDRVLRLPDGHPQPDGRRGWHLQSRRDGQCLPDSLSLPRAAGRRSSCSSRAGASPPRTRHSARSASCRHHSRWGKRQGRRRRSRSAEHLSPRNVPVGWVQETLVKHGAYLGPHTGRA